jgi:hypothetical protein
VLNCRGETGTDSGLGVTSAVDRNLLELGGDEERLRIRIVGNVQYVGFAANLAVFDVALIPSGRLVHGGLVPLSATGALEASFHTLILVPVRRRETTGHGVASRRKEGTENSHPGESFFQFPSSKQRRPLEIQQSLTAVLNRF